jgi:hypothetical protein
MASVSRWRVGLHRRLGTVVIAVGIGGSAVRRFGGSAVQRFSGSAVQRFSGSAVKKR